MSSAISPIFNSVEVTANSLDTVRTIDDIVRQVPLVSELATSPPTPVLELDVGFKLKPVIIINEEDGVTLMDCIVGMLRMWQAPLPDIEWAQKKYRHSNIHWHAFPYVNNRAPLGDRKFDGWSTPQVAFAEEFQLYGVSANLKVTD